MGELPINQVVCGDCVKIMRDFPSESVNMVMFSPPYWGLRNYGENVNTVWGGDLGCKHEWVSQKVYKDSPTRRSASEKWTRADGTTENADKLKEARWHESSFCSKCGAWYGQLGLEPVYTAYIRHLVEVGREIKRILRKDGSWYLNLGDTYYTGAGKSINPGGDSTRLGLDAIQPASSPNRMPQLNTPAKCKLLVPYRVALALIDDGWICRNDITWFKPNAMPSSVKDRLTCHTERVFHLVKSNKTLYWTNEKTKQRVDKQPLGTRGTENVDWEWVECPSCQLYEGGEVCKACEGTGKIKHSLWSGHCYYYDLDAIREPHKYLDQPLGNKKIERGRTPAAATNLTKRTRPSREDSFDPLGKNPGDVVELTKHDTAVERVNRFYADSLHTKEFHHAGKNPSDFWPITTKPFPEAHFAVYPEALCERPIKSSCPKDGIVLDPMCGAGTTLVVAKKMGRRFIGIDLNSNYCEMTRKRLARVDWPLEVFA